MLEGFEAVEIETTTIWTDGVQTFVGVELDDLLAAIGAEGEVLRAIAAQRLRGRHPRRRTPSMAARSSPTCATARP
jgi:hypothetical protein